MTIAEMKVKEFSDTILARINKWRETCSADTVLDSISAYIAGIGDGIDFCEEMRHQEQKAVDSSGKMDVRFPQPICKDP